MTVGYYSKAELMGKAELFTTTCSGPEPVLGSLYPQPKAQADVLLNAKILGPGSEDTP